MRSRLFTIPNMLTLSNLLCGSLAIVCVVHYSDLISAFFFVVAAMVFDFLDGLAARMLRQISQIGVVLDSLADLVSFGLAPSFTLFTLINNTSLSAGIPFVDRWDAFLAFAIVIFSALRLARFSAQEATDEVFNGLPTPACGIFVASLGMLSQARGVDLGSMLYIVLIAVLSYMLICSMPMLSLKFKSFKLKENFDRYLFLAICLVEFITFGIFAIPLVIATYILFSLVSRFVKMGGNNG